MVKGILKHRHIEDMQRTINPKSGTTHNLVLPNSLLWNEEELRLNEQIKADLSTEKIDEPKTPYIRDFSPEKTTDTEARSDKRHSCKDDMYNLISSL